MSQSMDSHMNFRMSSQDKMIIEAAAKLKGLKPNTYARQSLLEAAKREIAEMNQSNILILNNEDWEKFMSIMQEPVKTNENLKKAVQSFNEMNIK